MFVLLFVFVFGGAIAMSGPGNYTDFLMPGIFAQTIVFAAGTTAIGMTDDISKGIVDRFRSLPMSHSAVLTGRTFSDVIYNGGILIVLMVTGFVVGWRVEQHPEPHPGFRAAAVLRLRHDLAGSLSRDERPDRRGRTAGDLHGAVPDHVHLERLRPAGSLPEWLQPIAEWNPTSTLTATLRELWGNPNPIASDSLAAQEPALVTIVWVILFIVIFGPLAIRRYRRLSR